MWRSFLESLKLVLCNRVPLAFVVWFFALVPNVPPSWAPGFRGGVALRALLRWDGYFYLSIAERGYTNIANDLGQRDTNFWPLFPWLWRLVHYVIPSWGISGAVLNIALL